MCKDLVPGQTKADVSGDLVIESPKSLGRCLENHRNPLNYSKQNLTKAKSYLENITLESNLEGWSEKEKPKSRICRNVGPRDEGGLQQQRQKNVGV